MATHSGRLGETVAMSPWEWLAPFAAVAVATLAAYSPAIGGGAIVGDIAHLTRSDLQPPTGLLRIWFEPGATPEYRPLLHTAFWIEHRLWGDALIGYHLINVLQHAFASCLVLSIVRRLELPGGMIAALVFALHPAGVDSVAWISQQGNTLAATAYLSAALIYIGYDRERLLWQYDVALGLFLLALLTNAATAALPVALLALFWWERGQIEWRRDVVPLLPWFAIGMVALVASVWLQPDLRDATDGASGSTWLDHALTFGRILWSYLRTLVWPADLAFIHPAFTADPGEWRAYVPFVTVLFAIALVLVASRRCRGVLAASIAFGITVIATVIVNASWLRVAPVADRFLYLASLGLIVPASVALARRFGSTKTATLGATLIAAALGAMTWSRSFTYRDAGTLYQATIAQNPRAWLAHNLLGETLEPQRGRLSDAIRHYRQAIELHPTYATAHANLGRALAKVPTELPHALAAFERALALESGRAAVHVDYGNALAQLPSGAPRAIAQYENAIALDPDAAAPHFHLGRALETLSDRRAETIAAYSQAVRLQPDWFEAYLRLAHMLAREPDRKADSLAAYEGALHLQPNDLEARIGYAALLATIPDRIPDAIANFTAVLQRARDRTDARDQLDRLLATLPGGRAEAIAHLETAVRLRPDDAVARALLQSWRER